MVRASGLACLLMAAVMAIACGGSTSSVPSNDTSVAWTKSEIPGWANKLDAKVYNAFNEQLKSDSPLYTSILCDGKTTTVHVNRNEW